MRIQFSLRKLLLTVALICVITALVTFAAQWSKPRICIQNKSPATLTNVIVSGSGFSKAIDALAVGAEATISVTPNSDSGIAVAFDANGKHYDSGQQEYIAGDLGERFTATIRPDLKVDISRNR